MSMPARLWAVQATWVNGRKSIYLTEDFTLAVFEGRKYAQACRDMGAKAMIGIKDPPTLRVIEFTEVKA